MQPAHGLILLSVWTLIGCISLLGGLFNWDFVVRARGRGSLYPFWGENTQRALCITMGGLMLLAELVLIAWVMFKVKTP